ncbi:MAG: hypothetical protein KatS3mg003_0151 [Candidatus Nitrosocaldaceae archaeon]|nr:MAG: hypothetical protein KatS3mg003_0151 [Candidatus Nitrosocaldaceae archaeon]
MLRIAIIASIGAILVISALLYPMQNLIAQEVGSTAEEDDETVLAACCPPNQGHDWVVYQSADANNPITQHFDKILFKVEGKKVPKELKGILDVKVLDDPKEVASIDEKIRQVLLNNIRINGKFYNFTEEEVDRMKIKIEDVEYATVKKEPCINEASITYGVPDDFAGSPEPAYIMRLWPLHAHTYPPRDFDINRPNSDFIHTIDLPDCLIHNASIEMKLKADGDLPHTDRIEIFALDNVGNVCGAWGERRNLNHFADDGSWDPNDEMTLTLDLRALPLFSTEESVDLIPALNYCSGYLHIFIDDDTAVDYIKITFN